MKERKFDVPFWISIVFLVLLILGVLILKYVTQDKWILNVVDAISYGYIFTVGYWFGKSRNEKPSTLKGP